MKETITSSVVPQVPPNATVFPDYCNPDFPTLSFIYALCCDPTFARDVTVKWRKEKSQGRDWRDYLDPYRTGNRPFEPDAEELVAVAVPSNPPDARGNYNPSPEQAEEMVTRFINKELTAGPTGSIVKPRSPARLNEKRPWLSALGHVFVYGEDAQRLPIQLPGEVRNWMGEYVEGPIGQPRLSSESARFLSKHLVREMTTGSAIW